MKRILTIRLDRLQLSSDREGKLPELTGYRVVGDKFVRSQTTVKTYGRCRELVNLRSGAKVFWQYQPQRPWLRGWKVTVAASDGAGITLADLEPILAVCSDYRLLTIEIAFDFHQRARVDHAFVSRHGAFGKSRRRREREHPGELRYGGRKSAKYVRCYYKGQIRAYRVELELRSQFLRAHGISTIDDLSRVETVLVPAHIRFVKVDWERLEKHLTRIVDQRRARVVLRQMLESGPSLHALRCYLRKRGVDNVHRFLVPMNGANRALRRALRAYPSDVRKSYYDNNRGLGSNGTENRLKNSDFSSLFVLGRIACSQGPQLPLRY